ncbi:MAG: transcriptional repressor, partial [Verrucomicrobiota bacterium]
LGAATVYRAIKYLQEEGLLTEVVVPRNTSRYELTDLPHHHHFFCEDCNKLYVFKGCPEGMNRLAPPGFKVADHFLTLIGLCPNCAV